MLVLTRGMTEKGKHGGLVAIVGDLAMGDRQGLLACEALPGLFFLR